MAGQLAGYIPHDGRTLAAVSAWIRSALEDGWQETWQRQLGRLDHLFETIGEPAYGHYNRELFRPIQTALHAEGFDCRPRLPGNLELSEEHWGAEDHRERRMWALLVDERAGAVTLGAIVTRFFHDHTQLRLPEPPTVEAIPESDHDIIRSIVCQDPAQWCQGT